MSIYVFICPTCGRGSLHDNYCEDCAEGGEFSEFVPVERITKLERHNELLRAVVVTMRESYNLLSDYAGGLPDKVFLGVVSGYFLGATIAVEDAIDGGALDGEG